MLIAATATIWLRDDETVPQTTPSQLKLSRPFQLLNRRCSKFFGRETQTSELFKFLSQEGNRSVIYLVGEPGFGKTELARTVANKLLDEGRFDGCLWVSSRKTKFEAGNIVGDNVHKLTWKDFLSEAALNLGCQPIEAQLAGLFSQYNLLVVLDNAETAQLSEIVPNLLKIMRQGQIFITSKVELNLPYFHRFQINGLSDSATLGPS